MSSMRRVSYAALQGMHVTLATWNAASQKIARLGRACAPEEDMRRMHAEEAGAIEDGMHDMLVLRRAGA